MIRTKVFGVRVDAGVMEQAVDLLAAKSVQPGRGAVCVANVDMVTRAKRTPWLAGLMESAEAVVTDGVPLVWYLRRVRGLSAGRVYGPQLTRELCRRAAQEGLPVYFYGGTEAEVAGAVARLREAAPGLIVAGAESPPMLPAEPPLDEAVAARINGSGARIVFVGLGCPKQESWILTHEPEIRALLLGVGLAFAQIAGNKRAAPGWMQRNGLEWLFRLVQEPRRLWKRYLVGNSLFFFYLLQEWITRRRSKREVV